MRWAPRIRDTLTVSGGTGPYVWSVSSGSLPDGITLDSGDREAVGHPDGGGTSSFTVKVTDAAGKTATQATPDDYCRAVAEFPAPPAGEVGAAYSER